MKFLRAFLSTLAGMPKVAVGAVAIFLFLGIFAPWLTPHDPNAQDLLQANQDMSFSHWLGTDHLGRDTLSRLIAAARTSVVGMSLVLILALSVGVTIGTVAGYRRGWVEEGLMRIVDVGLAMPSLIVALAVIGHLRHRLLEHDPGAGARLVAGQRPHQPCRRGQCDESPAYRNPCVSSAPARCASISSICCRRRWVPCSSMPRRMRVPSRWPSPR